MLIIFLCTLVHQSKSMVKSSGNHIFGLFYLLFWNLIYFSSSILLCSSYNAIISLLLYRFQFFLLLCYYVLKGVIQIKLKILKGEKAQLFCFSSPNTETNINNRPFHSTYFDLWEKHMSLITLTMALFHSSFPVNCDSEPARTIPAPRDWSLYMEFSHNLFIIYTCAFNCDMSKGLFQHGSDLHIGL